MIFDRGRGKPRNDFLTEAEAEEKSSILGQTEAEAEDSVGHWYSVYFCCSPTVLLKYTALWNTVNIFDHYIVHTFFLYIINNRPLPTPTIS